MLDGTGVPLFAGLESTEDLFISTLEEMDKDVESEIDIPHPIYRYLKDNDLIEYRSSTGAYVPVKLVDKPNSTVKDFSAYDDVDNTPQDALSEAKFTYGNTVGVQMYSREELTINQGEEQLLDLVEIKQEQLETSMGNHFGDLVIGSQDADGRKMMGVGRIMAFGQKCGGIDPTVAGFGYWNPQQGLKAAGGSYALATEFRAGFRRLVRLCTYRQDKPDVFVCGEDLYDAFQAYAEAALRLSVEDLQKQRGWGDFNMFPLNGTTIIYDQGMGAKTGWLMNFKKYIKLRIHSGTNFVFDPWQMMESKVAKKRNCLVRAALYCKRRNCNGVITYT